jgi:hypothetical protein
MDLHLGQSHLRRLRQAEHGAFDSTSGDELDADAGVDLRDAGLINDNDQITQAGRDVLAAHAQEQQ